MRVEGLEGKAPPLEIRKAITGLINPKLPYLELPNILYQED
jgi:hypothetical protein